MASNISLGGIDLPDGADRTNGEGHVFWPDRDDYNPVIMQTEESLGGRLFSAQTARTGDRPITLEFLDHAWIFESPKDAILALAATPGAQSFAWYGETYSVLFDSEDGPACSFSPLLLGRGFSKLHWVGTVRLLTTA